MRRRFSHPPAFTAHLKSHAGMAPRAARPGAPSAKTPRGAVECKEAPLRPGAAPGGSSGAASSGAAAPAVAESVESRTTDGRGTEATDLSGRGGGSGQADAAGAAGAGAERGPSEAGGPGKVRPRAAPEPSAPTAARGVPLHCLGKRSRSAAAGDAGARAREEGAEGAHRGTGGQNGGEGRRERVGAGQAPCKKARVAGAAGPVDGRGQKRPEAHAPGRQGPASKQESSNLSLSSKASAAATLAQGVAKGGTCQPRASEAVAAHDSDAAQLPEGAPPRGLGTAAPAIVEEARPPLGKRARVAAGAGGKKGKGEVVGSKNSVLNGSKTQKVAGGSGGAEGKRMAPATTGAAPGAAGAGEGIKRPAASERVADEGAGAARDAGAAAGEGGVVGPGAPGGGAGAKAARAAAAAAGRGGAAMLGEEGRDVSGQYRRRDETCPVSTGGRGGAAMLGLLSEDSDWDAVVCAKCASGKQARPRPPTPPARPLRPPAASGRARPRGAR